MSQKVPFYYSLASVAVMLFITHRFARPIPLPAAGAIIFGWLGYWTLRQYRPIGIAVGVIAGLALGIAAQVRSYVIEDRVNEVGVLISHAGIDATVSFLLTLIVLLIALVPASFLRCRLSGRPKARAV
jgi:hypothetical protein